MSNIAIRVDNLSKQYRLGVAQRGHDTLRDSLAEFFISPLRLIRSTSGRSNVPKVCVDDLVWALSNVCFEVKRGEVIGIIGHNGAGKSTLLKILSRITEPTSGFAEIRGRVGSLLEVGTGFHAELTGRENIYLNGAILGMRKAEIDRKLDEIVAFAEVEKFIDTPVKRYSSGMYLRLAFAVAAHLEPEIMIVDEVLAVGDARFQRKCLGKMGEVAGEGRTVLFVSHNLSAVGQLCRRGILLSNGRIVCQGSIDQAVDTYMTAMTDSVAEVVFPESEESAASFTRFCLRNTEGRKTARFSNAEPIILEVEYTVRRTLFYDHIFVLLYRADDLLIMKAADDDGGRASEVVRTPGRYVTQIQFPGGILNGGVYQFRVIIGKRNGIEHDAKTAGYFEIEDVTDYTNSCFGKRNGMLLFPLTWNEQKASL